MEGLSNSGMHQKIGKCIIVGPGTISYFWHSFLFDGPQGVL